MNLGGIAAMLIGGFILWRHFTAVTASTTATSGGASSQPPPSGQTGSGTQTPASASTAPSSPALSQQTLPIASATPLAAAGDRQWAQVLTDRNVLYTVDQWNYFRVQGGQPSIDPSDMPILVQPGEEGMQITANEYLSRLARLTVTTWHT